MRDRGKSAALLMAGLAGVAAVTFVAAPTADARPFCDEAGGTTVCQTNGSTSIKATPGTVFAPPYYRNQIPWQTGGRRAYGGRR
ncbi:MAG: hypothetical protein ACPGVG_20580 [Mycobacterium sp.]